MTGVCLAGGLSEWLAGFGDSLYKSLVKADRWKLYLQGLGKTIEIAAGAVLLGIALGILVAVIKYFAAQRSGHGVGSGALAVLEAICNLYLTVIRGTPVLVQLMIIYFAIFSSMTTGVPAAILGFGINSGAYVAEIVRSGIQSIDKGQTEAGRSLGLTSGLTMRLIVLPQAIKNILPALFNEFIVLIKETSVAGTIAVPEMVKIAGNLRQKTYDVTPLYIVALIYLVIVIVLTQLEKVLERRLAAGDKR